MKKLLTLICVVIMAMTLGACSSEPEHTLSYVDSERLKILDQYDCIAIYTEYSNESSKTAIPADWVDVKAFQNGVEIPIIVPSGENIKGYIQCDSSVQSGTTANVVWLFQLNDESTVSVEFSDGTKMEVPLSEE